MGVWGTDWIRENYQEAEDGTIIENTGQVVVDADGQGFAGADQFKDVP